MLIAATHTHSGVIYGVVLIVIGILHLIFRGFYARRGQAIHDARQATAAGPTQRLYRNHSAGWYLRSQYWISALFVLIGIIDIAVSA